MLGWARSYSDHRCEKYVRMAFEVQKQFPPVRRMTAAVGIGHSIDSEFYTLQAAAEMAGSAGLGPETQQRYVELLQPPGRLWQKSHRQAAAEGEQVLYQLLSQKRNRW
jgi:hypothetical protein